MSNTHPVIKNRKNAMHAISSASEFYNYHDLITLSDQRLIEIYDRLIGEKKNNS